MAGFFIGNKWDVYNGFPSCIIAPFYSLFYGTRSSCSDFFNCFDLSTVPTVNTFWICIYLKTESRIFFKKKNKTPVRNFAINVVWGPKWKPQRIVFRSFAGKNRLRHIIDEMSSADTSFFKSRNLELIDVAI